MKELPNLKELTDEAKDAELLTFEEAIAYTENLFSETLSDLELQKAIADLVRTD